MGSIEHTLKVVSWNICNGLSDESRAEQIAKCVVELRPDLVYFPEGMVEHGHVFPPANDILRSIGRVGSLPYFDIDGREDIHSHVAVYNPEKVVPHKALTRKPSSDVYGRKAMHFIAGPEDYPLLITGLHGFDRLRPSGGLYGHEVARLSQAQTLANLHRKEDRVALIGDFNSMHAEDHIAGLLRSAVRLVTHLPVGKPSEEQTKLQMFGSLSQWLVAMAYGHMLLSLQNSGYKDADPTHRPTMRSGPLAVQLDHMMLKNVQCDDFTVHPPAGLSDHSAISATLRW